MPANPSPAPEVLANLAEDQKLMRDAENVLTWDAPPAGYGDPLMFGHLRRFAKEILRLVPALRAALTALAAATRDAERLTAALHDAAAQERRLDSDELYCFDGWNADEAYSAGLSDGRRSFALDLLAPRSPEGDKL